MKDKIKMQISKWVDNKKGSGEIALILLLMVLGLFFLTKFVFKIPFPFTDKIGTESSIEQESNPTKTEDK